MPTTQLLLGPVAFAGFEVPDRITFGGRQRLAIHRLVGGGRVVDALGADDADLAWSGVFSGPDAADRARLLDALRMAGAQVTLTWDAFFYTVVIAEFSADYSAPWWVPYRLVCTVVLDPAAPVVQAAADLLTSVTADLTSASAAFDVSAPLAAVGVTGAATAGTAANAAAVASLAASQAALGTQLAAAGAALGGDDPLAVSAAAGQLASLSQASAYLGRARVNLANAST
jgi:hypothetical protein